MLSSTLESYLKDRKFNFFLVSSMSIKSLVNFYAGHLLIWECYSNLFWSLSKLRILKVQVPAFTHKKNICGFPCEKLTHQKNKKKKNKQILR